MDYEDCTLRNQRAWRDPIPDHELLGVDRVNGQGDGQVSAQAVMSDHHKLYYILEGVHVDYEGASQDDGCHGEACVYYPKSQSAGLH